MARKTAVIVAATVSALALVNYGRTRFGQYSQDQDLPSRRQQQQGSAGKLVKLTFEFIRTDKKRHGELCEELLFVGTPASDFNLSAEYYPARQKLEERAKELGGYRRSGHSGAVPIETRLLHYLASQSWVQTVCETGFNIGHSSINYLSANKRLIVHSFDYGGPYAPFMARFINETLFPGRLFYHMGDSAQTLPKFVAENPGFRCSLMLVDGGHSVPLALADTVNLAAMADLENGNVIAFDDYPKLAKPIGQAWDLVVRKGFINDTIFCRFRNPSKIMPPGVVFGRVVKHPFNVTAVMSDQRLRRE